MTMLVSNQSPVPSALANSRALMKAQSRPAEAQLASRGSQMRFGAVQPEIIIAGSAALAILGTASGLFGKWLAPVEKYIAERMKGGTSPQEQKPPDEDPPKAS